jgi:hypothetical protein
VKHSKVKETIMKTIILSIAAVAALSTAAFASQRNSELPELMSRADIENGASVSVSAKAFVVTPAAAPVHKMTNFEAMTVRSHEREQGER